MKKPKKPKANQPIPRTCGSCGMVMNVSHFQRTGECVICRATHKPEYQDTQRPLYHKSPLSIFMNDLAGEIFSQNHKWWHDANGVRLERNKAELLCLIHSEVSEAMEGERRGLMDDKLPHRRMAEVELADTIIRILDYAGAFGYDIGGAIAEKLQFNKTRHDHTHEARQQHGGKKW